MLGDNTRAVIEKSAVPVLPIFNCIQRVGNIPERDMFNTFNMGVGMIFAVNKNDADKAVEVATKMGEEAVILGEVKTGEKGIDLC